MCIPPHPPSSQPARPMPTSPAAPDRRPAPHFAARCRLRNLAALASEIYLRQQRAHLLSPSAT